LIIVAKPATAATGGHDDHARVTLPLPVPEVTLAEDVSKW